MARWPSWQTIYRECVEWWPWRQRSLGERGERAAARWLQRAGYTIVARHVRMPIGELDLVALHERTIVFIEVRTRTSAEHGTPAETVDAEKQRRLTRLALAFLKRRRLLEHPCRFDVVSIVWPEGTRDPLIEHIPNAFSATGIKGMFS